MPRIMNLENCLQNLYENEDRDALLNDYFSLNPSLFSASRPNENPEKTFDEILSSIGFKYFNPEGEEASTFGKEYLDFLSPLRKVYDASFLENEPYYRALKNLSSFKEGNVSFEEEIYLPYQPFVCGDRIIREDLKSFTPLGCFSKKTTYPALKENGRIWMSLIPHEINTMKEIFARFKGQVLLYGLGLGYAAFEAARKKEVTRVVVIEKDRRVIDLFKKRLLPLFINKNKVEIIEGDAILYAHAHKDEKYDICFADLWHDGMDGLELYGKLLVNEGAAKKNYYWIENDILEYFSRLFVRFLLAKAENTSKKELLDLYGKEIVTFFASLDRVVPEKIFKTSKDINLLFQKECLKNHLKMVYSSKI